MKKLEINENKAVCCQKREEVLNKISIEEISVIDGVSEWIKWTAHKEICQTCKEFRTDSLNMMDKKATESDKDTYLKKYFTTE